MTGSDMAITFEAGYIEDIFGAALGYDRAKSDARSCGQAGEVSGVPRGAEESRRTDVTYDCAGGESESRAKVVNA